MNCFLNKETRRQNLLNPRHDHQFTIHYTCGEAKCIGNKKPNIIHSTFIRFIPLWSSSTVPYLIYIVCNTMKRCGTPARARIRFSPHTPHTHPCWLVVGIPIKCTRRAIHRTAWAAHPSPWLRHPCCLPLFPTCAEVESFPVV